MGVLGGDDIVFDDMNEDIVDTFGYVGLFQAIPVFFYQLPIKRISVSVDGATG
jgi:hypothetical protein